MFMRTLCFRSADGVLPTTQVSVSCGKKLSPLGSVADPYFLGLLDPDPLVRVPDPSIMKQK